MKLAVALFMAWYCLNTVHCWEPFGMIPVREKPVEFTSEGCKVGDNLFAFGESYNDGCNDCVCGPHGGACTLMACFTRSGCYFKDKDRKNGESWTEDCNIATGDILEHQCQCTNSKPTCTARNCVTNKPHEPGCMVSGKFRPEGGTWKEDCNQCRCLKLEAECSMKDCNTNNTSKPALSAPARCPRTSRGGCFYNRSYLSKSMCNGRIDKSYKCRRPLICCIEDEVIDNDSNDDGDSNSTCTFPLLPNSPCMIMSTQCELEWVTESDGCIGCRCKDKALQPMPIENPILENLVL